MTVEECYEVIKGDYADVVSRLRTDERIKKFLRKAMNDTSFVALCNAVDAKNAEDAFRAAHTLKGICLNLSLTNLGYSATVLTEALRDKQTLPPDLEPMLKQVKKDYALTMACIRLLVDD